MPDWVGSGWVASGWVGSDRVGLGWYGTGDSPILCSSPVLWSTWQGWVPETRADFAGLRYRHSAITFLSAAWGGRVGLGSGLYGYGQVGSGNSSLALRYFPLILAARGAALPSKSHENALRNRMKTHFDIA